MAETEGIRCMLMRDGTSTGAFFLADDLPADTAERDALLLRVMGSPDRRQIDGLRRAHPLTSKVVVVERSAEPDIDVDYVFLQVIVDQPSMDAARPCDDLLAGVGPFAVERCLVAPGDATTTLRIRIVNNGAVAIQTLATHGGRVEYDGEIETEVTAAAGTKLLPSGRVADDLDGHQATLIDNGMPVVLLDATGFGISGAETPADLESRPDLYRAVEGARRLAGPLMGLGDVAGATDPKVVLLSAPRHGGAVTTRTFIPDRVHTSIGVLTAASVAAGIRIPGAVGADLAVALTAGPDGIEHPSGTLPARVQVGCDSDGSWHATSISLRTVRKIFDGFIFPRPRL